MTNKASTIFDKINPDLLIHCYSITTNTEKINKKFVDMKFENKQDRLIIYKTYTKLMLSKCMREKGYNGLQGWVGDLGGKLRTSGGNCNFNKKLIQIAGWMIESDITKFEDLYNTILHEIAHANAWIKHKDRTHGPVWIEEARLIGCTGDRCLPKKYTVYLSESSIYKCRHPSDKCICVKSGTKQMLTMFSKKIPKLVCKKHNAQFDYIETKPYDPDHYKKTKILQDFAKQHGLKTSFEFGSGSGSGSESDDVIVVDDGDIIEIDYNGDVYSVEPDMCLKYD
jgi:hypothetical protein